MKILTSDLTICKFIATAPADSLKEINDPPLWFENFDTKNIVTPVDVNVYERLLLESKYNKRKRLKLINGFRNGFPLEFKGECVGKKLSPNLKLRIGSPTEIWNKVMKEVKDKRFAGPFKLEELPFDNFIQSPIGLVPKDQGKKTRLIFHLSFPKTGDSVNSGIPKDLCKVQYSDFDQAVKRCLEEGINCRTAKSDMSMAFRNLPMSMESWPMLVLKAKHPESGIEYFFFDKCLSFGSSISCKHFQDFSDSVAHLVKYRTKKNVVNYLDDFFFAAMLAAICNWQVEQFLDICNLIKFPVSLEKTFWASTRLVFLGLLLDTEKQMVCIPWEKVERAKQLTQLFLSRKKATVKEIQELCGYLNFLCKCVVPGRAFTMRLYSRVASNMKPHYHINITAEMKLDIGVWDKFLNRPDIFCRPFIDHLPLDANDVNMYSDASRNFKIGGFGAFCGNSWMYKSWNTKIMTDLQPSIQYLELYGVVAGVLQWIHRFKNKRIYLFTDNKSARDMINSSSSRCKNCMILIRLMTFECLLHNVRVYAKYVKSKENSRADHLSRGRIRKFIEESPIEIDPEPTEVPEEIWPIEKIWIHR